MGQPFRAVMFSTNPHNPYIQVRLAGGEMVKVDLEIDEDEMVVVNVRPGEGAAGSVDVEMHGRHGSKLMV